MLINSIITEIIEPKEQNQVSSESMDDCLSLWMSAQLLTRNRLEIGSNSQTIDWLLVEQFSTVLNSSQHCKHYRVVTSVIHYTTHTAAYHLDRTDDATDHRWPSGAVAWVGWPTLKILFLENPLWIPWHWILLRI